MDRVAHVRAEPRLHRANLVVGGRRRRGDPPRERLDAIGRDRNPRELVANTPRLGDRIGRAQDRRGGEHTPARHGVRRAPAESSVDGDRAVGVPLQHAVGLDGHRARRREHDVGVAGLDAERLTHRLTGERAGIGLVARDRDHGSALVEHRRLRVGLRPRVTVPAVERLTPPELAARRVHREHDAIRESRPGGHVELRGGAQRRRRAEKITDRRVETGPHVAAQVLGDRRPERDNRHRDHHRDADRDASDLGAARRQRRALRQRPDLLGIGAVDEEQRDEGGSRPADEQRTRVRPGERRVTQRAEPTHPEQHHDHPPRRERRQREHAEHGRRGAGQRAERERPTRAARRDRADRSERDRDRYHDDAPGRS